MAETTTDPQTLELSTEDGTVIFDLHDDKDSYVMRGLQDGRSGIFSEFCSMRASEIHRGWAALSSWRRSRQRY